MAFVVDASIAVGWLLQSQTGPLTLAAERALTGTTGWVPGHFGIEVARVMRRHERLGLVRPEIVEQALARLRDLGLKQDSRATLDVVSRILALARSHELRIADAAYLELALYLDVTLATRDKALARAALKAGVQLLTV
jgi:predicted nucleic acid-binding protein